LHPFAVVVVVLVPSTQQRWPLSPQAVHMYVLVPPDVYKHRLPAAPQ
jgi:hypothetical protein